MKYIFSRYIAEAAIEYNHNKERKYFENCSSKQVQNINLKRIIIPILAVAGISVLLFSVVDANGIRFGETQTYEFINSWGSEGTGDGEFSYPSGIAVDSSSDYVYVVDLWNYQIQKFDSNGNFITKWGSRGTGNGEFTSAWDISVDSSSGNVYVSDYYNTRIQKFDSNGNFIAKWGSNGTGDGEFNSPEGIAVDSSGNVYVTDREDRIQKFDSNGNFIAKWGSTGTGDGEFNRRTYGVPDGIAVDSSSGYVYVAEHNNHRIQKFDSNGNFITKWGIKGTGDGQFNGPDGIAVDSSGNVYVSDLEDRIQKFDSNGNFIAKWGSEGTGDGQFLHPSSIAVDSKGHVYVVDEGNSRIQVFTPPST